MFTLINIFITYNDIIVIYYNLSESNILMYDDLVSNSFFLQTSYNNKLLGF